MPIRHVVEQGECIATIAHRYGFADPLVIWNDSGNDDLREKRDDPHVLAPGDVVTVPDREATGHSCATGKTHVFVRRRSCKLHVKLTDARGQALASKKFELVIGTLIKKGKTKADGSLEVAVPPEAREAHLTVFLQAERTGAKYQQVLRIGHLDPADSVFGVQQRLHNLGWPVEMTGEMDEATAEALRGFQSKVGLRVTGEIDDSTRARLRDAVGGH